MSVELASAIKAVEDALGEIGVFPMNVPDQDGKWGPRTSYHEGWNDCGTEMSVAIWRSLGEIVDGKLILNMNDTFHYASSDCEEATAEEVVEVARLFLKHGTAGIDYWVAQKRGYDPEVDFYRERVEKVRHEEQQNHVG